MAELEEVKPTKYGFDVRRVANGLIVNPPHNPGGYRDVQDIYVFRNMTELAAWLLAQEAAL